MVSVGSGVRVTFDLVLVLVLVFGLRLCLMLCLVRGLESVQDLRLGLRYILS